MRPSRDFWLIVAFVVFMLSLIGITAWGSYQFKYLEFRLAHVQTTPGPAGVNGIDGQHGADGLTIVGPQGSKGDRGDQGNVGQSTTGSQGTTGPQGPQGEQGPEGPEGQQGQTGRSVMCRQTITGQTECKYVGDTEWVPEEEFNQ